MKKIFIFGTIFLFLFLYGCNKETKIKIGDIVNISYTGAFHNGTIFETNTKTIQIGSGDVIQGIEKAIINKKTKTTITTTIKPEDGYGYRYSQHNHQKISETIFDKLGLSKEIGAKIKIDKQEGTILEHQKDKNGNIQILVNMNPPETQEEMIYEIYIKEKIIPSEGYIL